MSAPPGRNLLSVSDLGADGIREILDLTDSFVEVMARPMPRVPALRAKTVVSAFFEDSTRTRLSFEAAARRLSAEVMTFTGATSSLSKGESLRDTVETIQALGADAVIVRHQSSGVPWQIARWLEGTTIINAGDGCHEHPTQALLDCYTITDERRRRGLGSGRKVAASLEGLQAAIVGDIDHSRVARSCAWAFNALGAHVTLVAPPTLLPPSLEGWKVSVCHDLDSMLPKLDVVYLLRMQHERANDTRLPSLREYTAGYGLTRRRAELLAPEALVMHPGPVNRGVEIAAEVASGPASVITHQVANGVALRMAVLYLLLGSGGELGAV
ncbi:MAG: aspartate carbamoyltransferase catalytic subunit [Acidimicrobiales bacterium]